MGVLMKWLKRAVIGLVVAIAIIAALSMWALRTESGARFIAGLALGAFSDRIEVGAIEGALAGPLTLIRVRYRDPAVGVALTAERVDVDIAWSDLLQRIVHVRVLALTDLDVSLHEPSQPEPQQPRRSNVDRCCPRPPIDVVIDALKLSHATVRRDETSIVDISEAKLVGRWTAAESFVGKSTGRFEWHEGDRTFAGRMQLIAASERADLHVELETPLSARLDLALEQRDELPWTFSLDIPRFDSRPEFPLGEQWRSGAATLTGRGTFAQGEVSGHVVIDDRSLRIDQLEFVRRANAVDFSGLMHSDTIPGEIRLSARAQNDGAVSRATAQLEISQGAARLAANADIELQPYLAWNIHARASQFDPSVFLADWEGSLTFSLDSEGRMLADAPRASLRLTGLSGHLRGRRIEGEADLMLTPQRVPAGSLLLESGGTRLRFHGELGESMNAVIALDTASMSDSMPAQRELTARASLRGRWPEMSMDALMIDVQDVARLQLREPVHVVYGKSGLDVSRACLAGGEIEVCARVRMQTSGELDAEYSLRSVPLALTQLLLPTDSPLAIAGTIEGRGDLHRTAQGLWFGDAFIRSRAGWLAHASERAMGAGEVKLTYEDLSITARVADGAAHASIAARLDESGSLSGELAVTGLDHAELEPSSTKIDGRVSASLPSLAWLTVMAPQLAKVQGHAEANAAIHGTLQDPRITASLDVRELAASVHAIGLHLSNGRLEVTPSAAGELQISGAIESGEGHLAFDGQGSVDGAIDLNIHGERFLAADIPGARVVATPKLRFTHAAGRMVLSGEVDVTQARIDLQNLPRGPGIARNSLDVIVVDDPVQARAEQVPLHADVTVTVGPNVELVGFGLNAGASGRLRVRELPGEPTVGSGQLEMTGTFEAHNRELIIQRGRLLFAASPLDDPTLDLLATREVEELTVGMRIAGTAKAPEVGIFSDPPMSEADALSYLLTDRPLDRIAEGAGDVADVALRSLGNVVGGMLARNVGQRLGIDDVAVREDAMIGGSVLTITQHLSPRLYLSYGVGLFEPGEVVTLRYRVREGLIVQAQRGPEHSKAGVEITLER